MTAVISADGIGYGIGSGGTVTQLTNKSTGVTLNKPCGRITMSNAALAAGVEVSFVVNNSFITNQDTVIVNVTGNTNYLGLCQGVVAGAFTVRLKNLTAGSLSDAVAINFAIIKGVTS